MSTEPSNLDPTRPSEESKADRPATPDHIGGGSEQPKAVPHRVAGTRPIPGFLVALYTMLVALLAGAAGWGVGELARQYYWFMPSEEALEQPYDFTALNEEQAVSDSWNAVIAFGAWGGLLGLGMGLAGGLTQRSLPKAVLGLSVGLVFGVIAGGLPSYWLAPWYRASFRPEDPNLILPLTVHGGIWVAVGLVAGAAYGLGRGSKVYLEAFGGVLGGLVGTIIYEVIAGIGFQMEPTANQPIPEPMTLRLIARILLAGFIAGGVLYSSKESASKPTTPPIVE